MQIQIRYVFFSVLKSSADLANLALVHCVPEFGELENKNSGEYLVLCCPSGAFRSIVCQLIENYS